MSDTATVITPLLRGSRAVELANGTWRKKLLPIGSVEYKGRQLHFTRDYLAGLVSAWNDQAYDQIPLQFADDSNRHTNDPERTRGWITDMELGDDGLYIQAELTERGERVLKENPYLGVSARIVENYARSDGKFYPAAVQHVLGTLDPRVPGLGSWERLDFSNGPQVIVDLSQSVWLGEPTGPDYAEDQLTDQELADFFDAMAEVEAEPGGYGHDELAGFDGSFTAIYQAEAARDQARAAADLEDLISPPVRDEDILSRAIARASAGIYDTSRVASFASPSTGAIELATELTMTTGEGICGRPDDFGRCGNRFHDLRCRHAIGVDWQASGPPRSTYETALSNFDAGHDLGPVPAAYGDGEDSYPIPQGTLDLAHALNQQWHLAAPDTVTADELFGSSYRGNAYAALAAGVGFQDLEQPQRPDYPDVSTIRAVLGV